MIGLMVFAEKAALAEFYVFNTGQSDHNIANSVDFSVRNLFAQNGAPTLWGLDSWRGYFDLFGHGDQ
jgi:hypothetical protein